MSSTFEKLNLKKHKQIVVLNAPESFEHELTALRNVTVRRNLQEFNEIEFSHAVVVATGPDLRICDPAP
jgi:hypothetical protein